MLLERADGVAWGGHMPAPVPQARYDAGGQGRLLAIGVTAAVHVVLLLGLLALGIHATRTDRQRIVAINLTPVERHPPPPEQAPEPAPVEQRQLDTMVRTPDVPQPVNVPRPAIALAAPAPQAVAAPPAPPAPAPSAPRQAAPAVPAEVSTVQGGDLGARVLSAPAPRYPVQSRRKREQGTVELLLTLGTDGTVETIAVSRSSGFDRLDDAALSAVRRWRWEPIMQAGAPVRVRGIVAIPFVLA
ncbi:TonB family protein [Croceibacterium sp. TMG7-5b_MA50]|uniref:energy transducer TonB n=1 Tax=Croceibacterium sp. TMG7-5b_MA50 TaxID=3121290 RepID=UPI0032217F65